MIPGIHKLRYLLATRSELFLRVCTVVVLLGVIGAGVTFVDPPTTDVTTTSDRRVVATTLDSQATVEEDSLLYPRGETLSNMPVYSRSVSPNVTVSAVTTPPRDEEVRIDQRVVLVYEARTAGDELFWQQRQLLGRTTTSAEGEDVTTNATIRIPSVERRVAELESEIGDAGRVTVRLEVDSRYFAPRHDGVLRDSGTLRIRDDSYEVERLSMRDEYGTTETQSRPAPSKNVHVSLPFIGALVVPHVTLAFALLGIGGAVGLGVTVSFAHRFDPATEQVALHKARYAEWISPGTLPMPLGSRAVAMETLEDLVDVAIDSGRRIVHDARREVYAVIDGEVVYYYGDGSEHRDTERVDDDSDGTTDETGR